MNPPECWDAAGGRTAGHSAGRQRPGYLLPLYSARPELTERAQSQIMLDYRLANDQDRVEQQADYRGRSPAGAPAPGHTL